MNITYERLCHFFFNKTKLVLKIKKRRTAIFFFFTMGNVEFVGFYKFHPPLVWNFPELIRSPYASSVVPSLFKDPKGCAGLRIKIKVKDGFW